MNEQNSIPKLPSSWLNSILSALKQTPQLLKVWKALTLKKLLYFPYTLSKKDKLIIVLLLAITLISGWMLGRSLYLKATIVVPDVGGIYREGMIKKPRTINPIFSSTSDTDRDIANLVFSSLFTYNGKGELEPDLAKSYSIDKDGKSYTINLRKNALWHDGKPVTADDVLFTIDLIQDPRYNSPLRVNWLGVKKEKLDRYTVHFILTTPYYPFIENLTVGILPKHLWENINPDQALLNELNLKPIGSGPYQFAKLEQDESGNIIAYHLKRNPDYYKDGPYLEKISFLFAQNEKELISLWQKGKVDGFGPVPADLINSIDPKKSVVLKINMPRIFGLFFNQKEVEVLSDKNIRKAISLAVDRQKIAKETVFGGAEPHISPLPPYIFGEERSTAVTESFNLAAANKLLDKSGWKDMDNDGIREKKIKSKGKTETKTLSLKLTTSDWPDLIHTAELIKDMLKKAGIEVRIEKKSLPDLEKSVIRPRKFEILLFGQVYGYEPDPFIFWHSFQIKDPGLNITGYINKKADKILEEIRTAKKRDELPEKYAEFEKIFSQDLPAVFLYSQLYYYLLPRIIKGVDIERISLPSDRFNNINLWYSHTKRIFKR